MNSLEEYLQQVQRFGIRPGLERIRALLQHAGNPQQKHPIVLVGGTNGKGSTCEFLAQGLKNAGLRIGLYTSPHLYRWNERIRILEVEEAKPEARKSKTEVFPDAITDDELETLFSDALPLLNQSAADENLGQPTEFETLTMLGLWHFARAKVDAAVVEVGLGGRWDATNVTEPVVSVVTHVALDHCDRLGNTHVEIARDKIEIARPGRVLVTAETRADVLEVFREHCDKIGAELWPLRALHWSNDEAKFQKALQNLPLELQKIGENSPFQIINAATAALAAFAFSDATKQNVAWQTPILQVTGRMEEISQHPLVLLDAANNPDGAQRAREHLQRVLESRRQSASNARLILILGISGDKDFRSMIEILTPLADATITTQSSSPRSASAEELASIAQKFCPKVEVHTPPQVAFDAALTLATPDDIICVTGSFFTLGDIKR